MYDDHKQYRNIGHSHAHLPSPHWGTFLGRDIDIAFPVLKAMSGKKSNIQLSLIDSIILDANSPDKIITRELLLKTAYPYDDFDTEDFLASCERLGVSHVVDRWMISMAFSKIENDSSIKSLSVGVSLQSLSCKPLWDYVELFSKHNDISHKLTFIVYERSPIADTNNIREWSSRVKRLGFEVAIGCKNCSESDLLELISYCPKFIKLNVHDIFYYDNELLPKNKNLLNCIMRMSGKNDFFVVASGVDNIELSSKAYAFGLQAQQGAYWNIDEKISKIPKFRSVINNIVTDNITIKQDLLDYQKENGIAFFVRV
jgi:EAL domain-containing protein (putative c-di-GMP-specific phosphodiesterase class I)